MAPTLVFTLFIGMNRTPSFKVAGCRFDGRGRLARIQRRNCRASEGEPWDGSTHPAEFAADF
jgi:hypothetical protein